jgi:hypothetical protein
MRQQFVSLLIKNVAGSGSGKNAILEKTKKTPKNLIKSA